jgi:hypothetical protein
MRILHFGVLTRIYAHFYLVWVVIFTVANLPAMGLERNVREVVKAFRSPRFVAPTLYWGWVAGPAARCSWLSRPFPELISMVDRNGPLVGSRAGDRLVRAGILL